MRALCLLPLLALAAAPVAAQGLGSIQNDMARQTIDRALDAGLEASATWRDPESGDSGAVTVIDEGRQQRAGRLCRKYRHTYVTGRRQTTVEGARCRDERGRWLDVQPERVVASGPAPGQEREDRRARERAREEAERAERQRLAREEAERLDRERRANEASRRDDERRAAAEVARREDERRAAAEVARLAVERTAAEAAQREAARLAAEAAAEQARLEGREAVIALQAALIRLRYLEGRADGVFGPASERAARRFAEDEGLTYAGEEDLPLLGERAAAALTRGQTAAACPVQPEGVRLFGCGSL